MRTVVLGVGNPTLTDDGVGLRVADQFAAQLAARVDPLTMADLGPVDVTCLCAGGLRLMEAMAGYDRAIVVDALVGGALPPGTIQELEEGDLSATHNLASVHDLSLPYALDLGRATGVDLPEEIRVFGVRAADVTTFSEVLSTQVAAAVPVLVDHLLHLLAGVGGEPVQIRHTVRTLRMGRMVR